MGCDIHVFLEKRVFEYDDKERKDGVWVSADTWMRDPTFDAYKVRHPNATKEDLAEYFGGIDSAMEGWQIPYNGRIYAGRNYNLFSILANVRNGVGFAGCETGQGFVPIAMPKGLPDDVSPQIKIQSDGWGCDGHSHSWLTLRELLDYDWEGQKTVEYGVVTEEEYKVSKEKGQPDSWCGMSFGPTLADVDNETMDKIISGEKKREMIKDHENKEVSVQYITQVKWESVYADSCRFFLNDTISKLKAMVSEFVSEEDRERLNLGSLGAMVEKAEDVRIVFFFDN